jgi:hypothetical protein
MCDNLKRADIFYFNGTLIILPNAGMQTGLKRIRIL